MDAAVSEDVTRAPALVDAFFAAVERRDADTLCALCAEDVELHAPTADLAQGGRPYRGRDGLRAYVRDTGRLWVELRPRPERVEVRRGAGPAGADVVVVFGRVYAWGAGRVVDQDAGWTLVVRDGLVEQVTAGDSSAAALALARALAAA